MNRAIKPLWTVSDHALGVTDLALRSGSFSSSFCSSAVYLLSSSMDKTIRIWSLFAHRLLCTISTPSPIHCVWIGFFNEIARYESCRKPLLCRWRRRRDLHRRSQCPFRIERVGRKGRRVVDRRPFRSDHSV